MTSSRFHTQHLDTCPQSEVSPGERYLGMQVEILPPTSVAKSSAVPWYRHKVRSAHAKFVTFKRLVTATMQASHLQKFQGVTGVEKLNVRGPGWAAATGRTLPGDGTSTLNLCGQNSLAWKLFSDLIRT